MNKLFPFAIFPAGSSLSTFRKSPPSPKSFTSAASAEELFSPHALSNDPNRPLRVLVACEESQKVCNAFRKLGHEAYSADFLPPSGGNPQWHIQGDVSDVLQHPWDLVIAHPPCDDLTLTGNRWREAKEQSGRLQRSKDFFLAFSQHPTKGRVGHVPYVAIENPAGIMSRPMEEGGAGKPTQYYNPWDFGHPWPKKTGLWLKGLSPLRPTNDVSVSAGQPNNYYMAPSGARIHKYEYGLSKLSNRPGPTGMSPRKQARSVTPQGVADAMASQWSAQIRREMQERAGQGGIRNA